MFCGQNKEPLPYNPKSEESGNGSRKPRKVEGSIKVTLQENMMNHMHSYNIGQVCNWLLAKQD